MKSEILECCDCGDNFCTVCDDEFRKCPDCGETLCGECAEISLDARMGRCMTCFDPELSGDHYPWHEGTVRQMYKIYTDPVKGKLRE